MGARLSCDLQKHCKFGDSSTGDMRPSLKNAVSQDGGESVIHKTSDESIQQMVANKQFVFLDMVAAMRCA